MNTSWNWTTVVPWVISLVTIAFGWYQFVNNQAQSNREPFLNRQLELGFEVSDTVAVLASTVNADRWERARSDFWRLYWGQLSIVEDKAVERAMIELGRVVPRNPVRQPALPMTSLQGPSYRLAHAIRELSMHSWDVNLPALQPERPAGR
ncbi:hypothetical protein GOD64_28225 [Sinorhizobium medicae]|nr:hypothetical protein [Sinorhizobium medicae]